VTNYGGERTLIAASIVQCVEWVVTRFAAAPAGDTVAGVAGDGSVLAFAVGRHERELRGLGSVGTVTPTWRADTVATPARLPAAVSADGNRIATLYDDGTIEVRGIDGQLLSQFADPGARKIALRRNALAAIRA